MPKVISEELKSQAISMREQGLSYKHIAAQLDISERWCKINLKQVVKKESLVLAELCDRSKTPQGVSKGEVAKAFEIHDKPREEAIKLLNTKVKQIRSKDKKNNIVRPDWMVPDMAHYVTQQVLETGLILEERCNDAAFELWCYLKGSGCAEDTIPSVMKIKNAMMGIAAGACSTSPGSATRLANLLESLVRTADELSNRNDQTTVKISKQPMDENMKDVIDYIL